jgi:hypothetical protein
MLYFYKPRGERKMIFWVSLTLFLCIFNFIGIACVFVVLSNSITDMEKNIKDWKYIEEKVFLNGKRNLEDGK